MNKIKTLTMGLMASSLMVSGVSAQGLLGERYFGIDAGYERLKAFGESEDGWGAGLEANMPLQMNAPTDVDVVFTGDYGRVSEGGVTIEFTELKGLGRAIFELQPTVKLFGGAGLGWTRGKLSGPGFSDSDSTVVIPLEVGGEVAAGPVAILPYFVYNVALDSDWDDYWTLGATAAYWVNANWGLTFTVDHTDFDDGIERLRVRGGAVFAY